MNIQPSLRQLRYLVTVIETRHFGRAAELCFVTQSTLSAGIQELERTLNATLLERTKRKVLPTPLGLEIAEQARAILDMASELTETARGMAAPLSGRFHLGVIPTIGPFVLPRALPALHAAYPDLGLYLREDQTANLLDQLKEGRLEAAIIALPYDISGLDSKTLGQDRFWVACPRGHPLTRHDVVTPPDLPADELLLLEDGHCLKDHALSACRIGTTPRGQQFQATSLYTLVLMVANGLGITFLPEIALGSELVAGADIVLKPMEEDAPPRELTLVWRKSSRNTEEMKLLGAFLEKEIAIILSGGKKKP